MTFAVNIRCSNVSSLGDEGFFTFPSSWFNRCSLSKSLVGLFRGEMFPGLPCSLCGLADLRVNSDLSKVISMIAVIVSSEERVEAVSWPRAAVIWQSRCGERLMVTFFRMPGSLRDLLVDCPCTKASVPGRWVRPHRISMTTQRL